MDRGNLNKILEQYISRFDELNEKSGNDEGYKWRAESRFKEYWNAEESLKQVQEEIEPLPDLTGEQVQHKKYGKGNVLECENGRMKIVFSGKEVTFQYPQAFVNGFLTCNEMDETVFKRNGEIEKKIESLKKEIKNAQLELQRLYTC